MGINELSISKEHIFWGAIAIFCATLGMAWWHESLIIAFLPLLLIFALWIFKDLTILFYLLFISLPFSSEIEVMPGMVLDLPTEPIMILFLGLSIIWFLMNRRPWGHIILHPITLLLFCHLAWMTVTAFPSVNTTVSFKFLLAKYWYVAAFYIGSWFYIRDKDTLKNIFWCLYIPLLVSVVWVLVRHAFSSFELAAVNPSVQPFYRNHVDYASIMVLSYPLIWIAYRWYEKGSWQKWLILGGLILLPIGIYFSYTRAAIIILLLYPIIYLILKMRWVKWTLAAGVIGVIALSAYYLQEREYLSLAPNYERTIYHDEFGNLLEATYKMEDLSTMERLYRWVAGGHMLMERPWIGTGPGTFYPTYQAYSVSSFKTYMSHNPEQSGVHNYYLMTATDQGLIGLLILLIFLFFVLLFSENIYHQAPRGPSDKLLIAGLFCILSGILMINIINDMLENIKVGSLFFFCLAILAMLGRHYELSPPIKDKP